MNLHKAILGEIVIDPFKVASAKPGICPFTLTMAIANFKNMKGVETCQKATPLMVAVDLGCLELVKCLIEEGADVNKGRIAGSSALVWALKQEHYDIASLLIKSGADVHSHDDQGVAPIYYAIDENSPLSVVQELVSRGVSAEGLMLKNRVIEEGRPIFKAIAVNNVPVVKFFLEQSVKVNFPLILSKEVSALTHAVLCNSIESVKLLIDYGAKIDGQDDEFPAPLLAAVMYNGIRCLRVLISAGVDIDKAYILKKIIKLQLGTDESDLTALHMAVMLEHFNAAKELLEAGADVNRATLVTKRTPLNFVCTFECRSENEKASQRKMVNLLLNNGADMYTIDNLGCSPALNCLFGERYYLVEELLSAGMDVNADIAGLGSAGSLLMYSTAGAVSNIIKLCLEHGGDSAKRFKNHSQNLTSYEAALKHGIDIAKLFFPYHPVDEFSSSAIHCHSRRNLPMLNNQFRYFNCIKKNDEHGVKTALQNGAEPRAFLTDMPFPIFRPVRSKNFVILGILLDHGVCPNVQNNKKETPLHIAAQRGFTEGCYYLLRRGACYNIKSSAGQSPLKISASREVTRLLKGIRLTFHKAKKGEVNSIKDALKRMPDALFFSYINCVNRKGNTLMREAILSGALQVADAIMALRLNRAKSH